MASLQLILKYFSNYALSLMNNFSSKLVITILIILLIGIGFFLLGNLFLKKPSQISLLPFSPSLSLIPQTKTLKENEILETEIIVDTAGYQVSAVGAILNFNPVFLEVLDIKPVDIFGLFPTKKFDNKQGKIKISGISWNVSLGKPGIPFSGEETLATVKFKVKPVIKETKTKITFEFAGFGKTTDSNIMEAKTAKDVLGNVYPAEFTLLP